MAKKFVVVNGEKHEIKKEKKPFYKRVWVWGLGIIIVIAATSGGEEETKETATNEPKTEQAAKSEPKKEEKAVEVNIGQVLKVGEAEFTVHGKEVKKTVGDQYVNTKAQGTFLILDVTVKNNGKKAITTDTSFFKLLGNGAEYEASSEADLYVNTADTMFFFQEVNPGISYKGKIAFDIPEDVANSGDLKLQTQTGIWGTEQGSINLK